MSRRTTRSKNSAQPDWEFHVKRETSPELDAVAWAENNGWIARKMQYTGRAGCPDRFFFGYGHIVLIEFKRAGDTPSRRGTLSDGQIKEHARFAEVGITVNVCYTMQEAVEILTDYMPVRKNNG